jgi:hypothetical protein
MGLARSDATQRSRAPRMLIPLFMDGAASDPAYRNIRDAKDGPLRLARSHCEYLWIFFQHHADPEFGNELRSNFDARYWEMYLTASLILAGYSVTCPKPGPDVGIIHKGQRIWFEATAPTRGAEGAPDQVPEMKVAALGEPPVVYDVPNEKITLRYLNSISVKYKEQYANWLKIGVVSDKDCFVTAINPRQIRFDYADTRPPRILQAGYTVGPPYLVIDRETGKASGSGYHFRDHLVKAPKKDAKEGEEPATVPTGVFQQEEYNGLSALLCSRVDAANRPAEMGDDFQLAPNPHAKAPLPDGFRLRGIYYDAKVVKGGYDVTPIPAKNS